MNSRKEKMKEIRSERVKPEAFTVTDVSFYKNIKITITNIKF